tara:strand:+ start:296 stop:454 length:159 start_codon:yes stop_codon:yes gene_type:complete
MKYLVEMTHRFEIETNDIEAVMRDYEFPDFKYTAIIGEAEFLDGGNTWSHIQ